MIRNDRIARVAIYSSAAIIMAIVVLIVGNVMVRGGLSIQLDYLLKDQIWGGFLNAISGSLELVVSDRGRLADNVDGRHIYQ